MIGGRERDRISTRNIRITVVSPWFLKRIQEKGAIPTAIFLHFAECFSKTLIWVTQFCGFLGFNSFKWFYPGPEFTCILRNLTVMMQVMQERRLLQNSGVATCMVL